MMYGMKKSDEAIVPLKAANKGAQAPAESPEGRASAKGNSRDQSTYRTQGRDGVLQAVERIGKLRHARFAVNHPRWEPYALTRTYGSERGDRGNPVPYRDHGVQEPRHIRTSFAGTWEVFIPPRQSVRGRRGKERFRKPMVHGMKNRMRQ